jgi:hypothetical protein
VVQVYPQVLIVAIKLAATEDRSGIRNNNKNLDHRRSAVCPGLSSFLGRVLQ